jgi:hypothetical protein
MFPHDLEFCFRKVFGVSLHCELAAIDEVRLHERQHFQEKPIVQTRGSAAADIDCLDFPDVLGEEFFFKPADIRKSPLRVIEDFREVAISANVSAEWDMDV